MTTLKSVEEVADEAVFSVDWEGSAREVEKLLTQDRQATAQVLIDLLEGAKKPNYLNSFRRQWVVGIVKGHNAALTQAQALIRQTLDPISNQE